MEAKIPIDHPTLSQHFGKQEFQAGDMIIHVGDVLSDLIIIDSGEVDLIDLLISDSTTYRTLNQPGCCVGGASFLSQTP